MPKKGNRSGGNQGSNSSSSKQKNKNKSKNTNDTKQQSGSNKSRTSSTSDHRENSDVDRSPNKNQSKILHHDVDDATRSPPKELENTIKKNKKSNHSDNVEKRSNGRSVRDNVWRPADKDSDCSISEVSKIETEENDTSVFDKSRSSDYSETELRDDADGTGTSVWKTNKRTADKSGTGSSGMAEELNRDMPEESWETKDFEDVSSNRGSLDEETDVHKCIEEEKRKSTEKKRKTRWSKSDDKALETIIKEIDGDLFDAPKTHSLAHCVGADLRMGAGIAIRFRQEFRNLDELCNQRVSQGGVAYIKHEERYVFYLVTKRESTGKPTLGTMKRSLIAMRDKCLELGVTDLAMPRIGCGLDRLEWSSVKSLLHEIFSHGFNITIYNYKKEFADKKPKTRITDNRLLLKDILPGTGLLYIGASKTYFSEEMKSLDEKYHFLNKLEKHYKLGSVVCTTTINDNIYGLICRETENSPLNYVHLQTAIKALKKMNNSDDYSYFGFQAFQEKDDPDAMGKIATLFRYSYIPVDVWFCWPPQLESMMPFQSARMSN